MLTGRSKLVVSEVTKVFRSQGHETRVFESFSLVIREKEFVSILGPTGCGKTTLLNLVAGFIEPDAGHISIDGRQIHGPSRTRAMIFQDDAVFPWYNTAANIEYGLKIQKMNSDRSHELIDGLLKEFGLSNEREKYPRDLSGGQRKRIDVARALANSPDVLLMDEPFGSLDPPTKETLYTFVGETLARRQTTSILVTHDIEEAIWMSDRVIVLSQAPATMKCEQTVAFERPRALELRFSEEFQTLRKQLASQLRS